MEGRQDLSRVNLKISLLPFVPEVRKNNLATLNLTVVTISFQCLIEEAVKTSRVNGDTPFDSQKVYFCSHRMREPNPALGIKSESPESKVIQTDR